MSGAIIAMIVESITVKDRTKCRILLFYFALLLKSLANSFERGTDAIKILNLLFLKDDTHTPI